MMQLTRGDLTALADDLKGYIKERDEDADRRNVERFDAVNERLDKVNGNIARHEKEIGLAAAERARLDQRAINLEREVFRRRQRVATDDETPALTRGSVKRALALVTGGAAAIEALRWAWPVLAALFKVTK